MSSKLSRIFDCVGGGGWWIIILFFLFLAFQDTLAEICITDQESLIARHTGRARTKVGLSDPVVPNGGPSLNG